MDKSHLKNIGILIILGLIMLLIVNPIGNFPLGDDYVYARPVSTLISSGVYKLTDTYAAVLIGQALWGALFCLPFGFSFTALRISVIILGFAGTIVFYLLMNKFIGNKRISLICAALLLINPIYFSLANSFMTDVPFLSFVLFAIYFFSKQIDSPKLKYLLPAIIFSIMATLVRQLGIIVPIVYALTQVIKNKRSVNRSVKYFIPAVVAFVILEFVLSWLKHTGNETQYDKGLITSLISKPNEVAFKIFERISYMLYYSGLSLLPILLFWGYNSFKSLSSGQKLKTWLFVAFFIPFLMYAWGKFPIKETGNIIDGSSIGPKTLRDSYILHVHDPGHLSSVIQYLLAFIGLIGAVLLLVNIASFLIYLFKPKESNTKSKQTAITESKNALLPEENNGIRGALLFQRIFLLLFASGYALLICIPNTFFDRYLLPLLPAILLLIGSTVQKNWQMKGYVFTSSLIYMFLIALFTSLATHDYLQWNRTRWVAANYLTKELNVPPYRVDGGMEYNGWMFGTYFPQDKTKKCWYAVYDEWMVGFGETPHYDVIKKIPYINYLPTEKRYLYILRRSVVNTAPDSSLAQKQETQLYNLEKNVEANPTPSGYFNLGKAYFESGRYMDCINENRKLLAINPNYLLAYQNIAVAYERLSMWEQAIETEKKALSIDSSFTYAKIDLNYALSMINSKTGGNTVANNYIAQSVEFFNEHKYAECIQACKKCLEIANSPVAWNNMGSAYNSLGQYPEAEKACEQALKLQPNFEMALKNMEIAKEGMNRTKQM